MLRLCLSQMRAAQAAWQLCLMLHVEDGCGLPGPAGLGAAAASAPVCAWAAFGRRASRCLHPAGAAWVCERHQARPRDRAPLLFLLKLRLLKGRQGMPAPRQQLHRWHGSFWCCAYACSCLHLKESHHMSCTAACASCAHWWVCMFLRHALARMTHRSTLRRSLLAEKLPALAPLRLPFHQDIIGTVPAMAGSIQESSTRPPRKQVLPMPRVDDLPERVIRIQVYNPLHDRAIKPHLRAWHPSVT